MLNQEEPMNHDETLPNEQDYDEQDETHPNLERMLNNDTISPQCVSESSARILILYGKDQFKRCVTYMVPFDKRFYQLCSLQEMINSLKDRLDLSMDEQLALHDARTKYFAVKEEVDSEKSIKKISGNMELLVSRSHFSVKESKCKTYNDSYKEYLLNI